MGTPVFAQKTPQVAEVIKAKRFEVVDLDGNTRAALSVLDGEPRLWLKDKNGKTSVMLSLNKDEEPSLWFADKSGQRRAGLGLDNGEPRMAFVGKNGQVLFRAP